MTRQQARLVRLGDIVLYGRIPRAVIGVDRSGSSAPLFYLAGISSGPVSYQRLALRPAERPGTAFPTPSKMPEQAPRSGPPGGRCGAFLRALSARSGHSGR
jgi:hypothetical protein